MNRFQEQYYEEFGYPEPNEVSLSAFVTASIEVRTVGDLRALVRYLDKVQVGDDVNVDTGGERVYVDLADTNGGAKAELIECGEHIVVRGADGELTGLKYDFLVTGHECG